MFVNLKVKPYTIEYFDSVGDEPLDEYMNLIKILKEKLSNINISVMVKINKIQHQFKGTECGVYSLNFIIGRLKGLSFEELSKNVLSDDVLVCRRDCFFRSRTNKPIYENTDMCLKACI
jgi:Ulp1 family protease